MFRGTAPAKSSTCSLYHSFTPSTTSAKTDSPRLKPPTSMYRLFAKLFAFVSMGAQMNHPKLKPLFVSTTLLASLAALLAASAQSPQQTAPPPSSTAPTTIPKTASQQFKNIQILKDVPADQLIPAMQFMTAS